MVSWVWQRISGLGLMVILFIHLGVGHLTPLSYEAIRHRLSSPAWICLDGLLLVLAVSHALNGLWPISQDYIASEQIKLILKVFLWILGVILMGIGLGVFFK